MDERFNPQMTINHFASQQGITVEDIGVAPIVVISWGRGVIQSLADTIGAQTPPHWFYNEGLLFYTGQVQGQRVSFAQAPVGAPGTVMMMEEMIVCGARVFLGLGWAGSLQPSAPVGTLLIPTACIREEGTSFHYLNDGATIAPSRRLVELLRTVARSEGAEIISGALWTTDAPYREFVSKIESYGRQGVWGVDMETSAMYALGQFRGVEVCNLLVVSDELWQEWRAAFRSSELKDATACAQRVILRCLANDALLE
jgi:uridine phosphorylase